MAKQLTAAQVAALNKPGAHKLETGLYLRIVGNSKTYSFRYSRHGKEHWLSIGPAHSVTLAEAKAAQFRSDLLNQRELGKSVKAPDFATFASDSLPRLTSSLADSGKREWRTSCKLAADHFGKMPVNEISVKDVCDLLEPIWQARPHKADKLRARSSHLR